MRNVFGVQPHVLEQATQGLPGRWSICIAENEEESPWEPLSVEAGQPDGASAVSATLLRTCEFVDNRHTQDPEQVLWDFADTISRTGALIFRDTSCGVVFCPEHAQLLAAAGFSKAGVKDWLIEHCGRTSGELQRAGKDGVNGLRPVCRRTARPAGPARFSRILPSRQHVPVSWPGRRNAAISMVVRVFGLWSGTAVPVEASAGRRWHRSGQRAAEPGGMTMADRVALVTGCGKRDGMGRVISRTLADPAPRSWSATRNPPACSTGGRRRLASAARKAGGASTAWSRRSRRPAGPRPRCSATSATPTTRSGWWARPSPGTGGSTSWSTTPRRRRALDRGDIAEVPIEVWDEVVRVNLRGTFLMSRFAVPVMRGQRSGRIVNISSMAGVVAVPRSAAYAASKAAVIALTRSMALDVAAWGITVNAICPGAVATSRAILSEDPDLDTGAELARRGRNIPVGRVGRPEDIAAAVAYLVDAGADYMTGQILVLDGGGHSPFPVPRPTGPRIDPAPKETAMRLRVLLEPRYGATYDQILALARATEEAGFDAFFRSDHFLGIEPNEPALRPTDSWTTLAGLAIQTSRVTLGTLMTAGTFRQPGQLAIEVATVDAMSGGRVELGIGTGWYEREHHAFGIPFPPVGERFDRLEEALSVITGLWSTPPGDRFSFTGKHFQLDECANFPATARDLAGTPGPRRGPRIIIGGGGPRRTPALAARFADEFNTGLGLGARASPSGSPTSAGWSPNTAGTRPPSGCRPRSRCAAPPPGPRPSGTRSSSARRARGC